MNSMNDSCDHSLPFISQNPSPNEKLFSRWFIEMKYRGWHSLGFGYEGMRINVNFVNDEVQIGRIVLLSTTDKIAAKNNLNSIEVGFGAIIENANQPSGQILQSTQQKSHDEMLADYVREKENRIYEREQIFEVMTSVIMMWFSPTHINNSLDEDEDDFIANISLVKINEHEKLVDDKWKEVVDFFGDNVPESLKQSYARARDKLLKLRRRFN
ncbi:hypothetical protein IT409_00325 [Candidatus Falkowbacteria bacterium]|nr:hypothetical protein [Candidatus Falkowbacteria bacterium]